MAMWSVVVEGDRPRRGERMGRPKRRAAIRSTTNSRSLPESLECRASPSSHQRMRRLQAGIVRAAHRRLHCCIRPARVTMSTAALFALLQTLPWHSVCLLYGRCTILSVFRIPHCLYRWMLAHARLDAQGQTADTPAIALHRQRTSYAHHMAAAGVRTPASAARPTICRQIRFAHPSDSRQATIWLSIAPYEFSPRSSRCKRPKAKRGTRLPTSDKHARIRNMIALSMPSATSSEELNLDLYCEARTPPVDQTSQVQLCVRE